MSTSTSEPRPYIPSLSPFYDVSRDLSWLVVRLTGGGFLLVHGLQKVLGSSIAAFATGSLTRRGIEPALPLAYFIFFLETAGALCLMLGLWTRIFAAMMGVHFLMIIFFANGKNGFSWVAPGGGWEYPLFWGLIILAIGLRGGGPYSLDRRFGREF